MQRYFKYILPLLTVIILLTSIVFPQPVYATTQTRPVIGEGTNTDGTYNGAPATWVNVTLDDGDTTTLRMVGVGQSHDFDFQNFAAATAINSVTLTLKARLLAGSGQIRHYVLTENVTSYGTYQDMTTSYVSYNYVWAVNPATGEAWTTTNLNDAEFGINWSDTDTLAVTYVYITVDYTADRCTMDTDDATDITASSATLNGEVTDDGGANVLTRGFVWDTTSVPVNPGNVAPAASGYANNWTEGAGVGNYGEYPFSYATGAVLVTGTRYYVRSCAQNANGWAYGDEIFFDALDNPSINTDNATLVRVHTARLNATVDDDGGEACTVQFAYAQTAAGPFANYAAIAAAGSTADATGTWETGQRPYIDINSLVAGTGYTFMASITNTVSTQYGSQDRFVTEPTINAPTGVTVICDDDSISLIWTIGDGSTNTLVRSKMGTYPTNTSDGTEVYFGPGASVEYTGLDSGTSYYFMLWGESGGNYSSDNITILGTTTALAGGTVTYDAPNVLNEWFAAPDYTKMQNTPIYGLGNWWADAVKMPRNTWWFLMAMGIATLAGVGTYAISHKIPIAIIVVAIIIIASSFAGIAPMWIAFVLIMVDVAILVVGERA